MNYSFQKEKCIVFGLSLFLIMIKKIKIKIIFIYILKNNIIFISIFFIELKNNKIIKKINYLLYYLKIIMKIKLLNYQK